MRKTAVEIGLSQQEFWQMTPHEFNLQVKGYQNKMENEMRMQAKQSANIINHLSNNFLQVAGGIMSKGRTKINTVDIDDLMGKKSKAEERSFKEFNSVEEVYEYANVG